MSLIVIAAFAVWVLSLTQEDMDGARPCTCVIASTGDAYDPGVMHVINNTDLDAVVQLCLLGSRETAIAGTIRAHETLTMTGISRGVYSFYYGFGKQWNPADMAFEQECEWYLGREPLDYSEPYEHYWDITLYSASAQSNADKINGSQFPSIKGALQATPTPWGGSASVPRAPLLAAARRLPLARDAGGRRLSSVMRASVAKGPPASRSVPHGVTMFASQ